MDAIWKKGQRVVSRTEPELGVGLVTEASEPGKIQVVFVESKESRTYQVGKDSPVRRFILRVGDKAYLKDGSSFVVDKINVEDNLYKYSNANIEIWEGDLSDRAEDQGTLDFFLNGNYSHHFTYDLRKSAREIKAASEASGVSGLVGPRVMPLAHQMYLAKKISSNPLPRVLLADEVGLGKTIEAGLIFSALKSIDRAGRILFLVPDSLKHQWLAEIYRRFGELVSVLDEDRCLEEEAGNGGYSAFEQNQRVLCSVEFLKSNPSRWNQAKNVSWDLLIVDEAHHLVKRGETDFSDIEEEEKLSDRKVVQKLAESSRGVLLLTATPSMFGLETQFGLLNILESEKFSSLESFRENHQKMKQVADLAKKIESSNFDSTDLTNIREILSSYFSEDEALLSCLDESPLDRTKLIESLVDRHGTGRLYFRNRRSKIKGFPRRNLKSVALDNASLKEKVAWLESFQASRRGPKILVLCSTKEQVLKIQKTYKSAFGQEISVFHEGLSIVERDQEAARFASDSAISLLVCSEIGGEGRNFQFCQDLVLFDLPRHPDLIEQRIGRLDRIGQGEEIFIHALWEKGTQEEILFRWYRDGLNCFERSWSRAGIVYEKFQKELEDLSLKLDEFAKKDRESKEGGLGKGRRTGENHERLPGEAEKILEDILQRTKAEARKTILQAEEGEDFLVDKNSFDRSKGEKIVELIEDRDDDPRIEIFLKDLFNHYGVEFEDFDDCGSILVKGESLSFIEDFPVISTTEDTTMAFDRTVALKREDMAFITQDHPIVSECLSFFLDRNEGVASVCKWQDSPYGSGALIEVSIVIEASGPKDLELSKFLSGDVKNFVFNHQQELVEESPHVENPELLRELHESEIPGADPRIAQMVSMIVEKAFGLGREWLTDKINVALKAALEENEYEIERIRYLEKVNPSVSREEVEFVEEKSKKIIESLKSTEPRLDAIRLIFTQ